MPIPDRQGVLRFASELRLPAWPGDIGYCSSEWEETATIHVCRARLPLGRCVLIVKRGAWPAKKARTKGRSGPGAEDKYFAERGAIIVDAPRQTAGQSRPLDHALDPGPRPRVFACRGRDPRAVCSAAIALSDAPAERNSVIIRGDEAAKLPPHDD